MKKSDLKIIGEEIPDFTKPESVAGFFAEKVQAIVKNSLHGMLVGEKEKAKMETVQRSGPNLYIRDQIVGVYPNDEKKGKTAKQIQDIVLEKIHNFERLYEDYDYKASEYEFDQFEGMQLIFHFVKKSNY